MSEQENQTTNKNFFGGFISGFLLLWDFLKIALIALVIIIPIRYFVFQPFIVSGSSMEPNFFNGQYLIIDELSYRFRDPERGQIVVLHPPGHSKEYYIKRIVGLPGETVKIDNGHVSIVNDPDKDGAILEEPYLKNQSLNYPHDPAVVGGKKTLTLGSDEYFMMGDNRLASSDSRDWGPLTRNEMVGKVIIRLFPIRQLDLFTKTPSYGFSK